MAKTLKEGDAIPKIELENQHGELIKVGELLKDGPVVLFFYPKDHTSGCTKEVCSFRDQQEQFNLSGAHVLGISGDSVKSHAGFASRHQLDFSLLSDKGNKVRRAFGVKSAVFGLIPGRVSYIIDQKGIIRGVYDSLTNPVKHVEHALEQLKSL